MATTLTTLTTSEKYFVSGQTITSSNLNKHASKHLSNETCYVLRGLVATKSGNTVTITPGACIVNYTLIVISDTININVSSLTTGTYHIVVSYTNPCYNTYPELQSVTTSEYNANLNKMCIITTLINGNLETSFRKSSDVAIDVINMIPLTLYFDVFSNKFKIQYLNYDFYLVDLYINGLKLIKDIDYTFNQTTKEVMLVTDMPESTVLKSVCADILLKTQLTSTSTQFESQLNVIEVTNLVLSNPVIDNIYISPIVLSDNPFIEVFKNGSYLHNISNSEYQLSTDRISFTPSLIEYDKCIILFGTNGLYDYFIANKFTKVTGTTTSSVTSIVTTCNYTVSKVYAFINGLLVEPPPFTQNGTTCTINISLTSNTKYTLFLVHNNMSGYTGDNTNYQSTTVTSNGNFEVTLTKQVVYGIILVFRNGYILSPNGSFSYNHNTNKIKIYNCSNGDTIRIFYR